MILSDHSIIQILPNLLPVAAERDVSLVNPASLDIRIGFTAKLERARGFINRPIPEAGLFLSPGEFMLCETYETFHVPNGFAMDLRLKSSRAREGFDHSLAFWVDPGWRGKLTMEIKNCLRFNQLRIFPAMRFAQVIIHRLDRPAEKPYAGRYQGATVVEESKR